MANYPLCPEKKMDCFAFALFGRCKCLHDTAFKGSCPFYKTVDEFEADQQVAAERLRDLCRFDLIEKYEVQARMNDARRRV